MNTPFIMGVTGGSGSGKTSFIRELVQHFKQDQVCLISQDNYYRPRNQQPKDENGIRNFDEPDSIDLKKMVRNVQDLIKGKKIHVDEYTYNNPELPLNKIIYNPAPILILEGIFILYQPELREMLDLKIFMHAMEHIMLARRIVRDEKERGYDLEDVLYRYQNHVMPSFRKYILPYKETCDIIINNNDGYEKAIRVITAYIEKQLPGKHL
jgi:uridine kinase